MRFTRLLSFALSVLLPLAPAAASGPESRQTDLAPDQSAAQTSADPITTLHVFSRETTVDVVVLDAKGHPISGLQRSDFQISEDGKPQPIRSFAESGPSIARGKPRQLPPLFHTNYAPAPLTGPVNIILIDAMHMSFGMVARAKQATAAYLQSMPEGTQVALMSLSVTGLHVTQGFTSDRDLLLKAINEQTFDIGSNGYNQAWITVDALTQLAQYLAPIKGRKNLLWITRGMPVPLLRDGGYGEGDPSFPAGLAAMNNFRGISAANPASSDGFSGDPTLIQLYKTQFGVPGLAPLSGAPLIGSAALQNPGWNDPVTFTGGPSPALLGSGDGALDMTIVHRLMDVYEYFTQEQVAISPIDPSGIVAPNLSAGATAALEVQMGRANQNLLAQEVAYQSGGHAYFNSNDLPGRLAEAIEEGSRYYTLAYGWPRQKPDGHYHRIAVQVDIPGARLAYRRGYNAEDPKPPKTYTGANLIRTALEGKVLAATDILFDAKLERSANAAAAPTMPAGLKRRPADPGNRSPYDLIIGVPQDQITAIRKPDGNRSIRVQFAFDAYDISGKLLGRHSQNVSLDLDVDKYTTFIESPIIFHEQIWFYPGPLFLRVGVYDQNSEKVGTLEIPITIPKP